MAELTHRRILVFGGGGFIGRHVVSALLRIGVFVRVLDMSSREDARTPDHPDLEWVVGSATDDMLVAAVAQLCDAAIFLATSSLPASANSDFAAEISSHVRDTVKCAEICDAQGVKKFIFASSGGTIYGVESDVNIDEESKTYPRNAYGVSKLAIEHYLRVLSELRQMRTLSLRIANPFGEGQLASRGQGFIAAVMYSAMTNTPLTIWGGGRCGSGLHLRWRSRPSYNSSGLSFRPRSRYKHRFGAWRVPNRCRW